jgi:hypothetical protein
MARSSTPNVERPARNVATKNHPVNLFMIAPLYFPFAVNEKEHERCAPGSQGFANI